MNLNPIQPLTRALLKMPAIQEALREEAEAGIAERRAMEAELAALLKNDDECNRLTAKRDAKREAVDRARVALEAAEKELAAAEAVAMSASTKRSRRIDDLRRQLATTASLAIEVAIGELSQEFQLFRTGASCRLAAVDAQEPGDGPLGRFSTGSRACRLYREAREALEALRYRALTESEAEREIAAVKAVLFKPESLLAQTA